MSDEQNGLTDVQIANLKALGFGVFAILVWLVALEWTGWFQNVLRTETGGDAVLLAKYGLLAAGLASLLRGETWHAVFFLFWSAYAWQLPNQGGKTGAPAFHGWFVFLAGIFHLFLAVGAYRDPDLGLGRVLIALGVVLSALCATLFAWGGPGLLIGVGGYISMVLAALAFVAAATEIGVGEWDWFGR